MNALPLFDHAAALALRDDGMKRAAEHSPRFADAAYAAIERIARRQLVLFTDDLTAELGDVKPQHPNAFGAVWMKAIRAGLIQRTAETRASADPAKHAHQYPIYFSLVFRSTP